MRDPLDVIAEICHGQAEGALSKIAGVLGMDRVEAERDELRAALRPFVDCNFTYFSGKVLGSDAKLTKQDVERARAALAGVPVVDDGQEWEQAARGVVANPRPIEEIKRDIADVMKRVDEAAAGVLESDAALHTFLNAAAGEGLVLDGVDAADLYIATFPEHYRATVASIEGDSSGVDVPRGGNDGR